MKSDKNAGVHVLKRGPYITTFSGIKFFPLDPKESEIVIEDIAHSLSQQCRFAGHTSEYYSVCDHSIRVAKLLSKRLRLKGLLHDASEAYLVDLPSPLKRIDNFSTYRRVEKEIQNIIYSKFGISQSDGNDEVHSADMFLLATEARDLMNDPSWARVMPRLNITIEPLSSKKAEKKFLELFKKLTGK